MRRRRRRILVPCFANAKPLPEAGNNYLGSECDHLPEAGNIYISIHSSAHTSAYSLWAPPKAANVAKLTRRRRCRNSLSLSPPPLREFIRIRSPNIKEERERESLLGYEALTPCHITPQREREKERERKREREKKSERESESARECEVLLTIKKAQKVGRETE